MHRLRLSNSLFCTFQRHKATYISVSLQEFTKITSDLISKNKLDFKIVELVFLCKLSFEIQLPFDTCKTLFRCRLKVVKKSEQSL